MLLANLAHNPLAKKPVIYGIAGETLTHEEYNFFQQNGCLGFILFARNIKNKKQVQQLVSQLKQVLQGEPLILIDQEGGRVARLNSDEWPQFPSANYFACLYQQNQQLALQATQENFYQIGLTLQELGINVNCAPVLDILTKYTHQIIGNRSFGENSKQVIDLAKSACQGLLQANVLPIIKHIPGHGRATSDSHLELPVVDASLHELETTDFLPFIALNQQKLAMTAHILYSEIDTQKCGTISNKVINIIRQKIGFNNILITDDLSMKALQNSVSNNAISALQAGCDVVLHCNANMLEMQEINQALPNISSELKHKLLT
jgi:beta-N-acetylhexosaminidase